MIGVGVIRRYMKRASFFVSRFLESSKQLIVFSGKTIVRGNDENGSRYQRWSES